MLHVFSLPEPYLSLKQVLSLCIQLCVYPPHYILYGKQNRELCTLYGLTLNQSSFVQLYIGLFKLQIPQSVIPFSFYLRISCKQANKYRLNLVIQPIL